MKFGLDVAQHQLTFEEVLGRVRLAEEAGFDGAWVFDHFSALYGDRGGPCLEAWTLLGALAAHTSRIRLGPLVTGVTHRHPSVLTTEIVTVDHVSGGRVEAGLGAAWNQREHRSLGIAFPSAKERMQRLEETIEIFRLLTSGEQVSFQGRHHQLNDAQYRPLPVQRPHPPIWIGANGPQLGLPLVGRQADVWHGWGADYARKWDVVRQSAEKAGRDPETIVRSTSLSISEPWAEVRRSFDQYQKNGVSYVIVEWPTEGRSRLEEFINQVMPDLAGG
ncbi:MAG TPA: TIGR03560 family F420-dependent LLM class oxidoreductase [Acidimicrobiia bacterium]|jgi:F420-dependent oxidoreductase-like protein|nr:TIGR03560 family F420-dependent LLM class oxidoreductase [Acidimicrobiia bacterium]